MAIHVLLSFTETLDRLREGKLTESDLEKAIFCFGCRPEYPYQETIHVFATQAPHQRTKITVDHINILVRHLRAAEQEERVIWRQLLSPYEVHERLSKSLEKSGGEALNPNLPPVVENSFLKIAIERINRNRIIGVEVVDYQ